MNTESEFWINDVLKFWFEELAPSQWFEKDDALDRTIAKRFSELHAKVSADIPKVCEDGAKGCLATILVLDQFSRNLYRNDPHAFANDKPARVLAKDAIERKWDRQVAESWRIFFYLPFTHSEDLDDQARSVILARPLGGQLLAWAERHKHIIERFGRFPHRNATLGRTSTEEELAFLNEPNSSF